MAIKKSDELDALPQTISYDDLMKAKVQVMKDGVVAYYLDPARALGEFVLRPVPQPMEESGEIPDEWRKPTIEEAAAADPKIDWKIPNAGEDPAEGEPAGEATGEEPTLESEEPTGEEPAEGEEPA